MARGRWVQVSERARYKLNLTGAPRARGLDLGTERCLVEANAAVGTGDLSHETWGEDPEFVEVPESAVDFGRWRHV